jgi:hypothetical protein
MQSISEQSDRAMGLVKAAHSSWKSSTGPDTEATELRQEFEARLAELATRGFQAVEHAGSLVFARALVEDGEYCRCRWRSSSFAASGCVSTVAAGGAAV